MKLSAFTAAHNAKEGVSKVNKDKTIKQNIARGTASIVSSVLGDAHFLTQTLADGIVALEQEAVHKLTGHSKAAIGRRRHAETLSTQNNFKAMGAYVQSEARRGAKVIKTKSGMLKRVDPISHIVTK